MAGFASGLFGSAGGPMGKRLMDKNKSKKATKNSNAATKQFDTDASGGDTDAMPASYKKGGKVRKTGKAQVHKGERVLNRKQTRKYERKRSSK